MKRSRRSRTGISLGTITMLVFTFLVLVSFFSLLPSFTGNQDIRIDAANLAVAIDESLSQLAASTGEILQQAQPLLPSAVPLPAIRATDSTVPPSATAVPVTPPPKLSFSLCATGSIILNSTVRKALTEDGAYQFDILTDQLTGALAADLSIATFENALSPSQKLSDRNMPAEILPALQRTGITALHLGYMEALNEGLSGLKETKAAIQSAGLLPYGMYSSEEERSQFTILQLNGVSTALLSYQENIHSTGRKQTTEEERAFAFRTPDPSAILSDIAAVRQAGAQVVIVSICWGKEGADEPTQEQRALAQQMANAGADVILGTNSGVLQPVQMLTADRGDNKYHPVLCAYSLGNLMTHDREKRANLASILLKTNIVYDTATRCVAFDNLTYTPTYAWRGKVDGRTLYRILLNNGGALPEFVDANQQGVMERCYKLVTEVMADTAIPMAQ